MKLFYRYKENNCYARRELIEKNFWFSKPVLFNDPCDSAMHLLHSNERVQVIDKLNSHLMENCDPVMLLEGINDIKSFQKVRNDVLDRIKNRGICCFTTKFDNPLMWAHYADEHRGVCLEYAVTDDRTLDDFHRVKYSNQIDAKRIMQSYSHSGGICDELDLELLTTKPKEWEYEEEYRYIISSGDTKCVLPVQLRSIIFGARFPEEDIEEIVAILSEYPARPKLKRATIDSQSFSIKVFDWSDQRLLTKYGNF